MKSLLYSLGFLTAIIGIFVAGCSRPPAPDVKVGTPKGPDGLENPFRPFLETARYPENPRAGDDWTRFRSGLDSLNSHFARPDVIQKMRDQMAKSHAFLESNAHLTEAEFAEIESTSFRAADAHYLDECFLLKDAARSLEVNDLSPVKQAHVHFRWVMRNVYLHEQIDTLIPPAFTLRRGYGSSLDRALVFLALLRQSQIEGCLIVVPDTTPTPTQILVAVLGSTPGPSLLGASALGSIANLTPPQLYLFDPRLGMALLDKDQQRILTLKNALDDPALLQPAQITPEQAKKLQAWLVCPLFALSPRLQELQKRLNDLDAITLFLNAKELHDEVSKATTIPMKIWNPPVKDKVLPNSPTRALWTFLPKAEGGIDETHRAALVNSAREPFQNVLANYAQINLQLLPNTAYQFLQGVTRDLFGKYDLQPREMYLRGLYESMVRRQERMQVFANDVSLGRLLQDVKFRKEYAEWWKQFTDTNANTVHQDPKIRAAAQESLQATWRQDQFVNWLMEIDREEKLERKHEKTVLTKILAIGMHDHFDFELARSQANAHHEAAARTQVVLSVLREQQKPTAAAGKNARDAWVIARSWWSNFYLDRLSLDSMVKRRLEQLHRRARPQDQGQNIEQAIRLLETLHFDVQKYFHAKLRLAECLEHLEGPKASHDYLLRVKSEIKAMKEKGLLRSEVEQLSGELRPLPKAQKRVDLLANDWSERGSYYWMEQHIDRRIAGALPGEPALPPRQ